MKVNDTKNILKRSDLLSVDHCQNVMNSKAQKWHHAGGKLIELGAESLSDAEYLKEILPELEYLKRRTDEILNKWLRSVLNRQKRELFKSEVFLELTEGLGQPYYEPDEDEEENEEEGELEEASEIVDKPVSNDENLLDNF